MDRFILYNYFPDVAFRGVIMKKRRKYFNSMIAKMPFDLQVLIYMISSLLGCLIEWRNLLYCNHNSVSNSLILLSIFRLYRTIFKAIRISYFSFFTFRNVIGCFLYRFITHSPLDSFNWWFRVSSFVWILSDYDSYSVSSDDHLFYQ